MVNDNKTKSTNTATLISSIIIILVVSNIFGFLTWAAYQIAATNSGLVPTVSLITGLAFWNMWTFITCVPMSFKVLFASGVQADIDARHAASMKKIYDSVTTTKMYSNIPPNYYDNTASKNDKLDS